MQQNFFDPESHLDEPAGIDPSAFFTIDEPEDTDSLPATSDLHEGGLAASTEAFSQFLTLLCIRDRITAQGGIGTADVFTVESCVPGLLQHRAPKPFTHTRTDVNMQWSLEAIDEKLSKLMKAAGAFFEKLIESIIRRIKTFRAWIQKANVGKIAKNFRIVLQSKDLLVSVVDGKEQLGESTYVSFWNRNAHIGAFNHQFRTNVSIDDFNDIRTGTPYTKVITLLKQKQNATAPGEWNNSFSLDRRLMSCMGELGIASQKLEHAKMFFNPALTQEDDAPNEHPEVQAQLPDRVSLAEGDIQPLDEREMRRMIDKMGAIEAKTAEVRNNLKYLSQNVEANNPNATQRLKNLRSVIHNSLLVVEQNVSHVSSCIVARTTFAATAAHCAYAMSGTGLKAAKSSAANKAETVQ